MPGVIQNDRRGPGFLGTLAQIATPFLGPAAPLVGAGLQAAQGNLAGAAASAAGGMAKPAAQTQVPQQSTPQQQGPSMLSQLYGGGTGRYNPYLRG
jgi:hypothetical protein